MLLRQKPMIGTIRRNTKNPRSEWPQYFFKRSGAVQIKLWPSMLNPGSAALLRRRRCGSNALPMDWLLFFLIR